RGDVYARVKTPADAAGKAADTNGDGTISVSEAAHTDWVGGKNCNLGGYVSGGDRASGDDCAPGPPEGSDEGADGGTPTGTLVMADRDEGSDGEDADEATESETEKGEQAAGSGDTQQTPPTKDETPPAECQATTPVTPTTTSDGQAPEDIAPNAHGLAVSTVAHSDAVGGKN